MRVGHAAANVGTSVGDFSDGERKPRMRHLCKNMQKAVQGTASRLLALIGIGGHSVTVSAPVPEGGVTRIQITTSGPVPHKPGMHPVPVGEFGRVPSRGDWGAHILPHPHPMYMSQKDTWEGHLDATFLHRARRALMSLGPWEGRIVAFVLGTFLLLALYLLALTSILMVGCGIGVLVRMFFVLTLLLVRTLRGNPAPDTEEETTIFVYAGDIAPPYEAIDEKKDPDVVPVMENRA